MFHGPKSGDRVVLPHQERFKFAGPFSVALWFKAEQFTAEYEKLIAKGPDSWRLQQYGTSNQLGFYADIGPKLVPGKGLWTVGPTDVADRRWHLAVAVYEPEGGGARQRLYMDGRLDAEGVIASSLRQDDEPVTIGTGPQRTGEFRGLIDEVAIFSRACSAEEVAAMFQAGSPTNTAMSQPGGEKK